MLTRPRNGGSRIRLFREAGGLDPLPSSGAHSNFREGVPRESGEGGGIRSGNEQQPAQTAADEQKHGSRNIAGAEEFLVRDGVTDAEEAVAEGVPQAAFRFFRNDDQINPQHSRQYRDRDFNNEDNEAEVEKFHTWIGKESAKANWFPRMGNFRSGAT